MPTGAGCHVDRSGRSLCVRRIVLHARSEPQYFQGSIGEVSHASFSNKQCFLLLASGVYFDVVDLNNRARKACPTQKMRSEISATLFVDPLDGIFVATEEGTVACYQAIGMNPLFQIRLSTSFAKQLAFDASTWQLVVMGEQDARLFAIADIVHRLERGHHLQPTHFPNEGTKLIHQRYLVDLTAIEAQPTQLFRCLGARGTVDDIRRDSDMLSLMVSLSRREADRDQLMLRLQRLSDLRCEVFRAQWTIRRYFDRHSNALLRTTSSVVTAPLRRRSSTLENGAASEALSKYETFQQLLTTAAPNDATIALAALDRFVALPLEVFSPGSGERVELLSNGTAVYGIYPFIPSHRKGKPWEGIPQLAAEAIRKNSPSLQTAVTAELRWLCVCVCRALVMLHARGLVALFHEQMIRYIAPNYCLHLPKDCGKPMTALRLKMECLRSFCPLKVSAVSRGRQICGC